MDNSPMFLDTVELVVHLPGALESRDEDFSFDNRKVWKLEGRRGYRVYSLIHNNVFILGRYEYKPVVRYRVRQDRRGVTYYELLTEFSIPKLLYGNNFMDVPKSDLDEVYEKLLDVLHGIYHFEDITMEMLEGATLKRMDCGSQVFFPDITAYNLAFNRIASARIDSRIDIGKTQYSKYGSGISISCDSWQFVFYNKTEELKNFAKSAKKAKFEKDSELMVPINAVLNVRRSKSDDSFCDQDIMDIGFESGDAPLLTMGKGLFDAVTTSKAVCMRFELRLNTKSKIDSALSRIESSARYITLREALQEDIPQRILQRHCEQLFKNLPRYDLVISSDEDILEYISKQDSKLDNMAKILGYVKMEQMSDQRRLRKIITRGKANSAWASFREKLKKLPRLSNQPDPIQPILDKVFNLSGDGTAISIK